MGTLFAGTFGSAQGPDCTSAMTFRSPLPRHARHFPPIGRAQSADSRQKRMLFHVREGSVAENVFMTRPRFQSAAMVTSPSVEGLMFIAE
jgi:hypothetical protein